MGGIWVGLCQVPKRGKADPDQVGGVPGAQVFDAHFIFSLVGCFRHPRTRLRTLSVTTGNGGSILVRHTAMSRSPSACLGSACRFL